MIPVDLNRLREAWNDVLDNFREADAVSLDHLEETAEAILDAPTVHMCVPHAIKVHPANDRCDSLSETCDVAWVALVAIDGEGA